MNKDLELLASKQMLIENLVGEIDNKKVNSNRKLVLLRLFSK